MYKGKLSTICLKKMNETLDNLRQINFQDEFLTQELHKRKHSVTPFVGDVISSS
jgi:hypothetical protein